MRAPPEAVRESMDARRRIRSGDHAYCGSDCDRVEAMRTWKRLALSTVRSLRALRREESERFGIAGKGR